MMNKAVFIDHKDGELDSKIFARMSKLFHTVDFVMSDDPKKLQKIKDADAFFVKISTKIDKTVIDAAPKLKYIGVCATAFDAVDAKYARSRGVAVCNLGGYSAEAVAEFFFAALLEAGRELEKGKNQARKEDYSFDKFMGLELMDKTLGVIGAGTIGGRIAEIGNGFGMRVLYVAKTRKPRLEKFGAKRTTIDALAKQSDVISINLILNNETKGMVSKKVISLMKKGCVVINLAPPPLIDQEAMMVRADKGDIIFAFDHSDDIEPAFAKRFLKTKNCIVYPPIAFRTTQADFNRWDTFAGNIEKFVAGKPQNVVN
jgi:glycerate dehydrogenase